MIKRFEVKYVRDIAVAHKLAWQKAFRGTLSDTLLNTLTDDEFIDNWSTLLTRPDRNNLIKVSEEGKAIGFVSFGPPYDKQEAVGAEIYGIYVHPDHWRSKVGCELMTNAIQQLTKKANYNGVVLWTMSKNDSSRKFYEKMGFRATDQRRTSQRSGESFEEIKYQYDAFEKKRPIRKNEGGV